MPTQKSFFKASLLLIFILSFSACSNNDKKVTDYELQYVMWKLGDGDGVEYLEKEIKPIDYTNPTAESIYVSFSESDQVEETSQFFIKDPTLLNTIKENYLEVPITNEESILNDDFGYLVGNFKAPFDANENILPPTVVATSKLELAPNTKVAINGIIKLKKITASYKAILKEANSQNVIEVEGKWTGVFHNGCDITYTTLPMK